tara:strand:- start:268 stop:741 length:474 start_codon:yes stop_codon:yes gene_type:complete
MDERYESEDEKMVAWKVWNGDGDSIRTSKAHHTKQTMWGEQTLCGRPVPDGDEYEVDNALDINHSGKCKRCLKLQSAASPKAKKESEWSFNGLGIPMSLEEPETAARREAKKYGSVEAAKANQRKTVAIQPEGSLDHRYAVAVMQELELLGAGREDA